MREERRRYFRINDSMGISYRQLGPAEAKALALQTKQRGINFDFAANFDNRIQTLLDACRIQSPLAAELIDLVNKKLNFVIQQMDIDADLIHRVAYTVREVNVSACGMAFVTDDLLAVGQQLQLDIILQPSELHIVLLAQVVDSSALTYDEFGVCNESGAGEQSSENPGYFTRLNFIEIHSADQEMLIQHIVKRQSTLLKERRREKNTSSSSLDAGEKS